MKISKANQKLVDEMEKHNYHFDDIESYRGNLRFVIAGYGATYFNSWKELKEHLNNVCWD